MAGKWEIEFAPEVAMLLEHLSEPIIRKFWAYFEKLESGPIKRDELHQHPGLYQKVIDGWLITYFKIEDGSSGKFIVSGLDFLELQN